MGYPQTSTIEYKEYNYYVLKTRETQKSERLSSIKF